MTAGVSSRGRPATRKRRRLYAVLVGMTMLGIAVALVLFALRNSIVFFYSPSDLAHESVGVNQRIRIGGLVATGSVTKSADGKTTHFIVTDLKSKVPVSYTGVLPDLFREGQGVVVEGRLQPGGSMLASEVLAKHDEKYMPPEVADALKRAGLWKHADQKAMK